MVEKHKKEDYFMACENYMKLKCPEKIIGAQPLIYCLVQGHFKEFMENTIKKWFFCGAKETFKSMQMNSLQKVTGKMCIITTA